MSYPVVDDVQTWIGLRVIDINGINVGTVSQVYIDEATDRPEWISVKGHETSRSHLAPLGGVRSRARCALVLGVTRQQVEEAASTSTRLTKGICLKMRSTSSCSTTGSNGLRSRPR